MKLMSNCSPVGACALELYSVRNVAATNTGRQDALSAGDFVTLGGERRQLPGPLGQVGDPSPHPGGARLIDTRRRGRRQAATSPGGGSPGRFCFGKAGDSRAGPDLVLTIPARQGPAGLLCAAGLGPFGPNTMIGSCRGARGLGSRVQRHDRRDRGRHGGDADEYQLRACARAHSSSRTIGRTGVDRLSCRRATIVKPARSNIESVPL